MKHFLIQIGEQGELLHDFSFHLIEAIKFAKWLRREDVYQFSFLEDIKDWETTLPSDLNLENVVPVGSLPFVFSWMQVMGYNVKKVTPLNVPPLLQQQSFVKRTYTSGLKREDVCIDKPLFLKQADVYKGVTGIISTQDEWNELDTEGTFDISEPVEIESEWRVFVQNDDIVGARHYGSSSLFPEAPDEKLLKEMVKTIEQKRNLGQSFPLSYTLDVGVNQTGTFLIECHPLVSCGLYGFSDMNRYPSMMIQGYAFFKQQAKQEGE